MLYSCFHHQKLWILLCRDHFVLRKWCGWIICSCFPLGLVSLPNFVLSFVLSWLLPRGINKLWSLLIFLFSVSPVCFVVRSCFRSLRNNLNWVDNLDQLLLCCIRECACARGEGIDFMHVRIFIIAADYFRGFHCSARQWLQILSLITFPLQDPLILIIWTYNFGCCDSRVWNVLMEISEKTNELILAGIKLTHHFAHKKHQKNIPSRIWLI